MNTEEELLAAVAEMTARAAPVSHVCIYPSDLAKHMGLHHIAHRLRYPGGRKYRSAQRRIVREAKERLGMRVSLVSP